MKKKTFMKSFVLLLEQKQCEAFWGIHKVRLSWRKGGEEGRSLKSDRK